VDIIMTNPPFGGEEEPGIRGNFPEDKQTSETALLFLQLVMRKLRRPVGGHKGGRCGIVVPNGVLFGDGVCARIKEELVTGFNLHTVVRLPKGVFNPYADIPTNILFFDRGGSTKQVWYYELALPEGRRQYTKTNPLTFEELADCIEWWHRREENGRAWRVSVNEILATGCNLDLRNPNAGRGFESLSTQELAEGIADKQQRIAQIVAEIERLVAGEEA
jgi:type I restriction enzyme M protein